MSSISLINISKSYAANTPKAVEDLSLEIEDGEFLCLLGPSGCGKTTTLRMLAGLEHPTGGTIRIGERPIVSVDEGIYVPPEKRELGLVFQSYALWPHMTVTQNVEFGLKLRKVEKSRREATATQVMEKLGIAKYKDRYPNQLSGGQQQRVALARMLALNPGIILLDEPLSNLDAKLRLEMRTELKRIHKDVGATIVFVTHDQWEAMTLASKIAVMSDGELQQVGTPDDIYERPANRFVAEFVGNLPINIIASKRRDNRNALESWVAELLTAMNAPAHVDTVGIRPEAIQIIKDDTPHDLTAPTRSANVVDVLPTGGNWIIELSVDGSKLFAITGSAPRLAGGDTIRIGVHPEQVHLFDEKGDRISLAHSAQLTPQR
jgi:iron(III) transport system ATP-binding protein